LKLSLSAVFLLLFGTLTCSSQQAAPERYSWKNVQIVGGGFVDGIIFHPTAAGVRYARTDMGGAYRWDDGTHRWQPLLDWISYRDRNLMGIESIAVDPSNPNRVYLTARFFAPAIAASPSSGPTFPSSLAATKMAAAMASVSRSTHTTAASFISARVTPACGTRVIAAFPGRASPTFRT
jgi:hypothetical protein